MASERAYRKDFGITIDEAQERYEGFSGFAIRAGYKVNGNYLCEIWGRKLVTTRALLVPEDVYALVNKAVFSGSELLDARKKISQLGKSSQTK